MKHLIWISILFLGACSNGGQTFEASGTFEAKEIVVSAEGTGRILSFSATEGKQLSTNTVAVTIDSTQLVLKKAQVQAQIQAVLSRQPNTGTQLAALQEQIKTANNEKTRLENLVKGGAATQKSLDDATAQIKVLEKQLEAQKDVLEKTNGSLYAEVAPLSIQISQLDDQLNKCRLMNPVSGTVLTNYVEEGEMAVMGKPMYKIARLDTMVLRAYVTGDQLPLLSLGQKVQVYTDNGSGGFNEHPGNITWVSEEAEFTPKTIQTKDERAHLVYAIKVHVPNDGTLKMGMYGEINW